MKLGNVVFGFALSLIVIGTVGCEAEKSPTTVPYSPLPKTAMEDDRLVGKSASMLVHGLACPSCAMGVEKQLKQTAGVKSVTMDVSTGMVTLELDPENPPTRTTIKDAVRHGGAVLVELRQP